MVFLLPLCFYVYYTICGARLARPGFRGFKGFRGFRGEGVTQGFAERPGFRRFRGFRRFKGEGIAFGDEYIVSVTGFALVSPVMHDEE